MAEAGAHLTSSRALEQPSIFEVLAQESLMEAVKPALRHAVKVLAESNPSRYGFLWRCFDELYLLLDVLLQKHFLSHCSASFSENFYGLKRVSGGQQGLLTLNSRSYWRSLLLLCLVPYLRAKLEAVLAKQRDEEDFSIRLGQSRFQRMYRAGVAAYPFVSSAWQALVFCQQLLFVFGVAKTHSPLLSLARVRLARLSAKDIRHMELREESEPGPAGGSPLHRTWHLLSQATRGLAVSLSTTLSLSVFFMQFLEWWYSSENQSAAKTLTSLPAPPPPLHLQPANQSAAECERRLQTCPLCQRPRTNATVLATSGFVFCYRCVYTYVKSHRRCPVTAYPSDLQQLIKIYSPEN
ncbi:peroxisome assembly protein 12 [Eucyclogobius newberryi]|uniref:peroxisome assembly protein 12 n=1 Tax=Eucyclogobius newberryi TaxID=166745 RepID=UPI003B5C32BD